MEKNKHRKAFSVIQKIENITRDDAEARSIIIKDGFSALLDGNYLHARNLFYKLITKNPKDIFSFYVIHMIEFNNGMTSSMLDTLHAVKEYWKHTDSFYGYCKGIESFILNENEFYSEGLDCGLEAININSEDIYAIHAVCHHYYDNQKYHEGKAFMEQNTSWKHNYGMRIHLYWHYALFIIKTNEKHLLHDIYKSLRNKNSSHNLEDLDATSFLFRLSLESKLEDL